MNTPNPTRVAYRFLQDKTASYFLGDMETITNNAIRKGCEEIFNIGSKEFDVFSVAVRDKGINVACHVGNPRSAIPRWRNAFGVDPGKPMGRQKWDKGEWRVWWIRNITLYFILRGYSENKGIGIPGYLVNKELQKYFRKVENQARTNFSTFEITSGEKNTLHVTARWEEGPEVITPYGRPTAFERLWKNTFGGRAPKFKIALGAPEATLQVPGPHLKRFVLKT